MSRPEFRPEENIRSVCSYCGTGCGIRLGVKDNRIFSLIGDENHPTNRGMLCSKGRELHHTVRTSDRLLRPQLRTSLEQPFAPVDWDTALEHGAEKFSDIIRKHGPEAVAFYVSGQLLTEDYYAFNKLMKGFIGCNNIDTNSRLCMSSAVAGYKRAFGADGPPSCYADIELAEHFFIIGGNPAYAHPIVFRRLEAAKEANPDIKVVVADPRRTDTCSIADLHLPLRPGTDVPLLQAMLNVLIWEDAVDRDYIARHTQGFEALGASVRAMTPRRAADICGLNAADIVQASLWFAENRTLSFWCQGMNQSSSGTDNSNALTNLHLATGQVGKPGCGPFSLTGQSNAMGGREVGGMANMLAAHRDYTNPEHRVEVAEYWGVDEVSDKPGLTATELFAALESGSVKAIWIACTNPVVSMPDAKRVEAALKKAELVMVSDAYHPTDTTRFAHILFPAAGWAEKEGSVTNSERCITHLEQALPAPGLSRPDWKITADFARRLGQKLGKEWQSAFAWEKAEELFNEHRGLTRGMDLDISGLSYAILDEHGPQQWPYPEGAKPAEAKRLYSDGCFQTSDGRARFIDMTYRPVAEPTDEQYPLSMTTGRIRDQWHTMTKTGNVPALMQHYAIPQLQIHPDDAAAYQIKEDDLVRVASRRGEVIAPARISKDIRSGLLFLPMNWGEMTAKGGRANSLTQSVVDPVSKQPEFKHAAVRIAAFEPAWRGMMLISGEKMKLGRAMIEGYTYGVSSCAGSDHPVTAIELACSKPLRPEQYKRLDQMLEQGQVFETLNYSDRKLGINRKAWLQDGHLIAVRWVGGDISTAQWLRKLMLEGRDVGELRPFLLAPGGPVNKEDTKGRVICACQNVGELELKAAMKNGARSVDAIKACTMAGTGCGSCVPELKRLLSGS
ncbi:MAG: nitrate reductase [Zetaproteobacteria bacterium CG_4_9_14_3_um_filter_53_7]|nr:MAG: nitrate reductase [Zetaproteobacteria bacterium CG_4_9_14_3_um_filter_53_7]